MYKVNNKINYNKLGLRLLISGQCVTLNWVIWSPWSDLNLNAKFVSQCASGSKVFMKAKNNNCATAVSAHLNVCHSSKQITLSIQLIFQLTSLEQWCPKDDEQSYFLSARRSSFRLTSPSLSWSARAKMVWISWSVKFACLSALDISWKDMDPSLLVSIKLNATLTQKL